MMPKNLDCPVLGSAVIIYLVFILAKCREGYLGRQEKAGRKKPDLF